MADFRLSTKPRGGITISFVTIGSLAPSSMLSHGTTRSSDASTSHRRYTSNVDTVTVRELRNSGGDVLRRVEHGERIVITRDGTPVAELRPLPRSSAGPAELIRRRKNLPPVNPNALRRDIDDLIDPSL